MHRGSFPASVVVAILTVLFVSAGCMPPEPHLNREFPVNQRDLSPPMVEPPIHECAKAVHVFGFIPHGEVRVYANGTVVGTATPDFGFADIQLTRELVLGEIVTATQTILGVTSPPSYFPVPVTAYLGPLNTPEVNRDLFACGRIVPVHKLVPSTVVHVFGDGSEIGSADVAGVGKAVWTQSLAAGEKVTAQQKACEDHPSHVLESPMSTPVAVQPDPQPIPYPVIDASTVIVGNDAVALGNLYVGAEVNALSNGSVIGGGFANASSNWVAVDPPLKAGAAISANQKLCGPPSPNTPPVTPSTELKAPQVLTPICAGSQYAILRNTVVNANVVLFRNGTPGGYGGAVPGDLILSLGGNGHFSGGEAVTARQYLGSLISPVSNVVSVVSASGMPAVEVFGGEPFFAAEPGEQPIGAPVFPRGRGAGPEIVVRTCCDRIPRAMIVGPKGDPIAEVSLTAVLPGYYTGQWDWHSTSGWAIPNEIPVGTYSVRVTTGCHEDPGSQKFHVIFNPDDVGGPARFSYDETGVWFGTRNNASKAVVYHLHPDDARPFQKAITAANGEIDPLRAAEKVKDAEQALFAYSLSYHTDDVIDMLENFSEAQCADDANVLVAMLRGIGIPAHPVTADAALETGAAGWTFDTWVEFLVPRGGGTEWLIVHPHEYPTLAAKSRGTFGASQSVATKGFNDLVIMADEHWIWNEVADNANDVTYDRNSCQEPNQTHLTQASWLTDLCELGYWNPNHWDCEGISTSSAPLTASWSFELEPRSMSFGGRIRARLKLANPSRARAAGPLVVDLVSDLPISKKFPDAVVASPKSQVAVEPGRPIDVPVDLELPRTLPVGHDLYLRARLGRRLVALEPLAIPSTVDVTLKHRGELAVGKEVMFTAVVRNRSDRALEGVRMTLRLPPGVVTAEEARSQSGNTLRPDDRRELTWRARLVAPLETGSAVVNVETANGGWAQAVEPIHVEGTAPPDGALDKRR